MNVWNRLIIDGNAVYEIDEECLRQKEEAEKKQNRTLKGGRCGMGNRQTKSGDRLIIDGNAVYEIDEECLRQKEEAEKKQNRTLKGGRCGMGNRQTKSGGK